MRIAKAEKDLGTSMDHKLNGTLACVWKIISIWVQYTSNLILFSPSHTLRAISNNILTVVMPWKVEMDERSWDHLT